MVNSSTLHRGAKYFMDSGRAATHEEAMALLQGFGLTIHVGAEIAVSRDEQVALLTLVNAARRSFLAGVEVVGLPDAKPLAPLTRAKTLTRAVKELGGRLVRRAKPAWPAAVIGDVPRPVLKRPVWRLAWSGWRAGVVPARDGEASVARAADAARAGARRGLLRGGGLRLPCEGPRYGRASASRHVALESGC